MAGKKRRYQSENPLASARSLTSKGNVDSSSNSSAALDALWFRKCGGGYRSFVEYYAHQPGGVVTPQTDTNDTKCPTAESPIASMSSTHAGPHHQTGRSRAAKRRRKRKGATMSSEALKATTTESNNAVASRDTEAHYETSHLKSAFLQFKAERQIFDLPISFDSFLSTMARPLPLTFRLRNSVENSRRHALQRELQKWQNIVSRIPFVDHTIYQACLPKSHLSTMAPVLQHFVTQHSQNGSLARQELGSMLPVCALQQLGAISAGCKVLDVCASPGSKTLQALEIVGPTGRVVANDVNIARLEALKAAVERSGMSKSLKRRLSYLCEDATKLQAPQCWDVILADVPCSGDGTCRKDKHILPTWSPQIGNELHATQRKILQRALDLVKPGGVVCYSTCSLNPIENEAVVGSVLTDNPACELVKWNLQGDVQCYPGVADWHVAQSDLSRATSSTIDDEDGARTPLLSWPDKGTCAALPDSLWPPINANKLNLNRCVRLLPQANDSGGFFLAVIKNVANAQ